ncbi:MAG: hypothetical protein ACRER0_05325, partial [Gammaproteobacteria bacterium]
FSTYPGGAGDNFYPGGYPSANYGPKYDDIGELYTDQDESGTYKAGDWFFDFNHDTVRNGPDGTYHGGGCVGNSTVTCASVSSVAVGEQLCLVMATSEVLFPGIVSGTHQAANTTVIYAATDLNGNVPSSGTTYALVNNGTSASLANGGKEASITCANSPPGLAGYGLEVTVPSGATAGSFYITATSPSGLVSFSLPVTVP